MFKIADLINKHEFIAKLNNRLSNLFDGKFSSLKEVPNEFTPVKHSHEIVTEKSEEGSIGFIDYNTLNSLKETFQPNANYVWQVVDTESNVNLRGVVSYFADKINSDFLYQTTSWNSREVAITINPFKHNVIYATVGSNLPLIELSLVMQELSDFYDWHNLETRNLKEYIMQFDATLVIPITFKIELPCAEMNIDFKPFIKILDEGIMTVFNKNEIPFRVDRTCFLVNLNHDLYIMGSNGDSDSVHFLHLLPDEGLSCTSSDRTNLFIRESRMITIQTLLEYKSGYSVNHLRVIHVS